MLTFPHYVCVLVIAMFVFPVTLKNAADDSLSVVETFHVLYNAHWQEDVLALFDDKATLKPVTVFAPAKADQAYSGRAEIAAWLQANFLFRDPLQHGPLTIDVDRVTWAFTLEADDIKSFGLSPMEGTAEAVVRDGKIVALTFSATSEWLEKYRLVTKR